MEYEIVEFFKRGKNGVYTGRFVDEKGKYHWEKVGLIDWIVFTLLQQNKPLSFSEFVDSHRKYFKSSANQRSLKVDKFKLKDNLEMGTNDGIIGFKEGEYYLEDLSS